MNDYSPELAAVATHFDRRADAYADKYCGDQPRHLYEHEKRERARWASHWIDQYAQQKSAGQCLDVGCGDGRFLCNVLTTHPGWQGTGIDVSDSMIQNAETRGAALTGAARAQWHAGTLEQVEQKFDVVVSLGVVGYQSDQLEFLRELSSRVRPNGLLIFTFANAFSIPRRLRTAAQSVSSIIRQRSRGVRFRTLSRRQVDGQLDTCGMQCAELRWLCFGLGLPHGGPEVRLSQWCESKYADSAWAESLAQVGLVCYQRCK